MKSKKILNKTICVVGLEYVGLPLAEDFSRHIRTIGYRGDQNTVDELNNIPGNRIEVTTDPHRIKEADFVIIAELTPVTKQKLLVENDQGFQYPDNGPNVQGRCRRYPGVPG